MDREVSIGANRAIEIGTWAYTQSATETTTSLRLDEDALSRFNDAVADELAGALLSSMIRDIRQAKAGLHERLGGDVMARPTQADRADGKRRLRSSA
jgi:hypothetical protein